MKTHVAFVKPPIRKLILSGEKTVESRLSKNVHPASRTQVGDLLIFKCGSGFALAEVSTIESYQDLLPEDISKLSTKYRKAMGDDCIDYWRSKSMARYAVFLHFQNLRTIHIPKENLPSVMFGWVQDYKPPHNSLASLLSAGGPVYSNPAV